jgi:ribose transport system substrate-binding protein
MKPAFATAKLGAVLWLVGLCGCGKPPESAQNAGAGGSDRIVFITNGDSPFWDAAQKGWEDVATEKGLRATFLRNKTGDAAGQIRLLDGVQSQSDVKGVAVSVIEASAVGIIDRLKELRAKGVEVLTVDSDTAGKDAPARRAYIGTNNLQAGKVAGEIAKLLLPHGGEVVAFVGTMDADNAKQRVDGFKQGAGDKLKLAEVMEDQADAAKARENVAAALLKHKNLAMPFGIYSYDAPAIAEEVAASGKRDKLKILTFDAEVNTMKAIKAGQIDATVVQNTYDMGAVCAQLLAALLKKDQAASEVLLKGSDQIDTGVRVVVPDDSPLKGKDSRIQTHKEFEAYMQSKGLKST